MELVKEITSLEMEILHLERHLLSLYRTAFQQHVHRVQTRKSPSEHKKESQLQTVADKSMLKVNSDAWLSSYHGQLSTLRNGFAGLDHQVNPTDQKSSSRNVSIALIKIFIVLVNLFIKRFSSGYVV